MGRKDTDPRVIEFAIKVRVCRLGTGYVALAMIAGREFRGNRYGTRFEAAKDLFLQLSQNQNMDANLALDIASSGEDPSALNWDDDDEPVRRELPSDGEVWAVGEDGEHYRILVGTPNRPDTAPRSAEVLEDEVAL